MILNINDYENFMFDCDGVILDSNNLKTDIFSEVLKDETKEIREQFIKYHLLNTGVSRYEKFTNFFKDIKKQKNFEDDLSILLKNFSNLLVKNLLTCQVTKKAREFLEKIKSNNKNVYMVSASDENELIHVLRKRKLDIYFDRILGSPRNKIENINLLKKIFSIEGESIFFGDSKSDFLASQYHQFKFIYMKRYSLWAVPDEIRSNILFKEVGDFSEIDLIE